METQPLWEEILEKYNDQLNVGVKVLFNPIVKSVSVQLSQCYMSIHASVRLTTESASTVEVTMFKNVLEKYYDVTHSANINLGHQCINF